MNVVVELNFLLVEKFCNSCVMIMMVGDYRLIDVYVGVNVIIVVFSIIRRIDYVSVVLWFMWFV